MTIRTLLGQLERPREAAGAVFAIAVLVTLLFQTVLPAELRVAESTDYTSLYAPVARNILAGRGITVGAGTPAIGTPPGYPVVLAGLFGLADSLGLPEGAAHLALACVAMGICCVLVYFMARSVWGALPALVAPLIWMTYPFTLWLTKQPNSEIPFLIVFYGAFGLFWSSLSEPSGGAHRRYLLAGLLVGAAALIRPIAIGAGVAFGALLWLTRRDLSARSRLGLVTALLLGNLLAVSPWEVWLYGKAGRVVVLGTNGAASAVDGVTFALDATDYRKEMRVPAEVRLLMRDTRAHSQEVGSPRAAFAFVLGELKERPLVVAELVALKIARSWYGTDTGRHEAAILLIQALYAPLVLWASVAAFRRGGKSRRLTIAVWTIVVYFWAMAFAAVPLLRYTVPAIGLLFALVPALFIRAGAAPPSPAAARAMEAHA